MTTDRPNTPRRPSVLQYAAYSYGSVLPPSMHAWVVRDLGGPGANARTATRLCLPVVVALGLVWLIPTTVGMHVVLMAVLLLPMLYFAIVLNRAQRRHRLQAHGLDPDLADWWAREKDYALRSEYEDRFGR